MRNFPGVIPQLMGAHELRDQFSRTTPAALHDMRVSPVNYRNRALLIGDAAHTMVPFYGQGLNVGLEDVRILFEDYLNQPPSKGEGEGEGDLPDYPQLLTQYSGFRQPNVAIMNELALKNYTEMRVAQKSWFKVMRRRVEETMQTHFPELDWYTLYSRVAFSNEPFTDIKRKDSRQEFILQRLVFTFTVLFVLGLFSSLWILYYGRL
jgi:kynurenine 3-monooxygenase